MSYMDPYSHMNTYSGHVATINISSSVIVFLSNDGPLCVRACVCVCANISTHPSAKLHVFACNIQMGDKSTSSALRLDVIWNSQQKHRTHYHIQAAAAAALAQGDTYDSNHTQHQTIKQPLAYSQVIHT